MKDKSRVYKSISRCIIFIAICLLCTATGWGAEGEVASPPASFDNEGKIQGLEGRELVVNDQLFLFESGTLFYSESGRLIGSGAFAEGTSVGLVYKDRDRSRRILTEVWKIKPKKK